MKCVLYRPESDLAPVEGGMDLMEEWFSQGEGIIWIHCDEMNSPEEQACLARFEIHELALQDAKRERHPPKVEVFEDQTFLIFKVLRKVSTQIDCETSQVSFFVGDRFLISAGHEQSKIWGKARAEFLSKPSGFPCVGMLAARLIRLIVDQYLEVLLLIEERMEEIEIALLRDLDDKKLAEVISYQSDLKVLRRIFTYHEQVLRDLKTKDQPGFASSCQHYLNDIYEQQERACSLCQLYYDLASDLVNGYLSLSAHRLNQIMKILTVVTVIFVPLGFLAGIYGMNFEYIPELKFRWGYFVLLGVMATISTVLLVVFRRRRWI